MGFIDVFANTGITQDEEGRSLWYPWGVLGRGFVLPADRKPRVQRFLLAYQVTSIILTAPLAMQIVHGGLPALAACVAVALGSIVWYYVHSSRLTSDLAATPSKLTLTKSFADFGRRLGLPVCAAFSIMCLALAPVVLLSTSSGGTSLISIGGFFLLAGVGAFYAYIAWLVVQDRGRQNPLT